MEFVPDEDWKTPQMLSWHRDDIEQVLDRAQTLLEEAAASLHLQYQACSVAVALSFVSSASIDASPHARGVQVVRKERAVGIVPTCATLYEVLEDLAISVDYQLTDAAVPFCAFNGGGDVFVDIGNKSLGLHALKTYIGAKSSQVRSVTRRCICRG